MAEKIVINAKCQRPSVCNAIETLLIDDKIADKFLPRVAKALAEKNVELRGDERTRQVVPMAKAATEDQAIWIHDLQAQLAEANARLEALRQQRDAANAGLTESKVALATESQMCASFGHQRQSLEQ